MNEKMKRFPADVLPVGVRDYLAEYLNPDCLPSGYVLAVQLFFADATQGSLLIPHAARLPAPVLCTTMLIALFDQELLAECFGRPWADEVVLLAQKVGIVKKS